MPSTAKPSNALEVLAPAQSSASAVLKGATDALKSTSTGTSDSETATGTAALAEQAKETGKQLFGKYDLSSGYALYLCNRYLSLSYR